MTITEFITDRLAEDERELVNDPPHGLGYANLTAQMARDIAAKRKILAEHQPEANDGEGAVCDRCADWTEATRQDEDRRMSWPCTTVRALASVWSDHPSYQEAQRP